MELTKPSGFVAQSVDTYHVVDTVLCLGISVLSTSNYHPFISTIIYPKPFSNLLNFSCYMELLNISGLILNDNYKAMVDGLQNNKLLNCFHDIVCMLSVSSLQKHCGIYLQFLLFLSVNTSES